MAPYSSSRLHGRRFYQAMLDHRASLQRTLARFAGQGWLRALPLSFVHYPLCSDYRFEPAPGAASGASVTRSLDLAFPNKAA